MHEYAQAEYKAHTSAIMRMTIQTASKAIICQSMRKKVPCSRQFLWWIIASMDLKTLLFGSMNLLWSLPQNRSTRYKANIGKQHLSLEAIKVPFINIPPQQFTAPPTADIWHPMAISLENKNHQRSKGSTPAIGISAVPARHKSESPWGNMAAFRWLHLLTR